jgi:hypothetical protein
MCIAKGMPKLRKYPGTHHISGVPGIDKPAKNAKQQVKSRVFASFENRITNAIQSSNDDLCCSIGRV